MNEFDYPTTARRGERVRYTGRTPGMRGRTGVVDYPWTYATTAVRWDDNGEITRVRNTSISRIPPAFTSHEAWRAWRVST